MNTYTASASAAIPAPPAVVYAVIANYSETHLRILPRPPFTFLEVDEGGVGAGTVVRFGMMVMGKEQTYHSHITEPEPGRVLTETNRPDGPTTSFTVEPTDEGRAARVTISTSGAGRGGLLGWIERALTEMYLKGVYEKELKQLAQVAAQMAQPPG